MNATIAAALEHPESELRVMIDQARREPDAGRWAVLCDLLDEMGADTGDICEIYANPPEGLPSDGMAKHPDGWPVDDAEWTRRLMQTPVEDNSLRPLLAAWAESRISKRLAERVRACRIRDNWVYDGVDAIPVHEDTAGGCLQYLKRRVLSEFLDAPILGPHASRRKTRRALRELRELLEPHLGLRGPTAEDLRVVMDSVNAAFRTFQLPSEAIGEPSNYHPTILRESAAERIWKDTQRVGITRPGDSPEPPF